MGNSLKTMEYLGGTGTTTEIVTEGGTFIFKLDPEDLKYLPRLVEKAVEFIHGCGYTDFVLTQKAEDPYDFNSWEWTDKKIQ